MFRAHRRAPRRRLRKVPAFNASFLQKLDSGLQKWRPGDEKDQKQRERERKGERRMPERNYGILAETFSQS